MTLLRLRPKAHAFSDLREHTSCPAIELKRVGMLKLVGELRCCCRNFLSDLVPKTMSAKRSRQKTISGAVAAVAAC